MTAQKKLNTTAQRVYDFLRGRVVVGGRTIENPARTITSRQAIDMLGETRLSARIYELKEAGIETERVYIKVKNRFGEERRVKVYSLAD